MLGELSADEVDDVLRSEVLGRIGCVADGWPYVVPVTYVYDGESVFVHSGEGLKLRAMRESPQVCFEVEQIRSTSDWRTVVAKGRFEQLQRDTNEYAMTLLSGKFASVRPSASAHLERNDEAHRLAGAHRPVLYRIRLVERTGRFERS